MSSATAFVGQPQQQPQSQQQQPQPQQRSGSSSIISGSSSGSSTCASNSPVLNMSMAHQPSNGQPTNGSAGGGGGRLAVIGVTRVIKLRRRGASGFGFSIRGGREYGAGFYVSDVQPGGEAHRAGLRIGDQILRVNGYPVEDAVHQEIALLAKNQQILVLKIRSVGMIPVKDNPNDPVTWHMVQQQQQQLQYGEAACHEIRLRLLLDEKGKLGCGVCRGLVPGLTVQGTREGGAARVAGLKAGDVIVWCNGHMLTDLPFERAIEVMRSSAVLDVVVQRPIANHIYDSPEALWVRCSSGYDSETGSASPPPALQATTQQINCGMSSPNRHQRFHSQPQQAFSTWNPRSCCPAGNSPSPGDWHGGQLHQEWTRRPNNTTVIRVNQGGQGQQRRGPCATLRPSGYLDDEPIYDPVAPRDFEVHDFDANPTEELDRRAEYRREHGIREAAYDPPIDDLFRSAKENGQLDPAPPAAAAGKLERKTVTTVEVHQSCPPVPPSMPPPFPCKWPSDPKPINAMGKQMGSTMSMGSTGSTETESSLESSCGGKDSVSTASSCLSASSGEAPLIVSFSTSSTATIGPPAKSLPDPNNPSSTLRPTSRPTIGPSKNPPAPPKPPSIDLGTAISQELQRRANKRNNAAAEAAGQEARKPQNPESARAQEQKVTHDKLMEEFKRAHQRMFSNAQQRNQSTESLIDQSEEESPASSPEPIVAVAVSPDQPARPKQTTAPANKKDQLVEMQSIDSFKLKDSPSNPAAPKPPSTYFEKPNSPQQPSTVKSKIESIERNCAAKTVKAKPNDRPVSSKASSSCTNNGGTSSPRTFSSKVALKIGSYESGTREPAKLGFLGHSKPSGDPPLPKTDNDSNNNVDISSCHSKPAAMGGKEAREAVSSRLQSELAATLQLSNLRNKTDEVGSNGIAEESNKTNQSKGTIECSVPQNHVEKLTTAFNNKVTIRVNPETAVER